MKNPIKSLTVLALACTALSSCGVIFGGSRYYATITAKDHPNAKIFVNGNEEGAGTVKGLYKRNRMLDVEVKEEGCDSYKKSFDYQFRTGNFILSVISWGFIGIIVDLATGASYKPDHKHDPTIQRMSDKDFRFMVDYKGCPVQQQGMR